MKVSGNNQSTTLLKDKTVTEDISNSNKANETIIESTADKIKHDSPTESKVQVKTIDSHNSAPVGIKFDNTKEDPIVSKKGGTKSATGEQVTYPPTRKGNGDGKVVYFFSGYSGSDKDQKMWKSEQPGLMDDIAKLRANGYTVVVDPSGTKKEFQSAVYDSKTAGVYWTGHGYSGGVSTNDGGMKASDIDNTKVSPNLRFVVFQSCNTGKDEKGWEKALKTDVKAWDKITSTGEANDFTDPNNSAYEYIFGDTEELDDLIDDRLIDKPWK